MTTKIAFTNDYKKKKLNPILLPSLASIHHCGATRIRTGDTRIFSPMLYQLSYGTLSFAIAKVRQIPNSPNFSARNFRKKV